MIYAKAVNEGEKLIYKYKYDDVGNRLAYQFGGMMPQTKYGGVSGRQVPQAYANGGGNIKTHWCARKEFFKYNSLNQIANNGYVYDDYGNLIKTPDTEYTFDLHNRLVMVRKGKFVIKYSYDPLGQRIKSVKTVEGKPSGTTLFLMSGMIEQARAKVASGGKQLASIDFHTLGLDLAGSLTSTGGVEAVLATSKTQTSGYYTRTYLYDGNGNVISLCKPDTGIITANYTYSPFGKLIKSGGIDKQIADFTFSTKYADETELSYYGYRFYSAKLGRWLKRDLIREKGGTGLYIFVANSFPNYIDQIGLACCGDKLLQPGEGCCTSATGAKIVYNENERCCDEKNHILLIRKEMSECIRIRNVCIKSATSSMFSAAGYTIGPAALDTLITTVVGYFAAVGSDAALGTYVGGAVGAAIGAGIGTITGLVNLGLDMYTWWNNSKECELAYEQCIKCTK